MKNFINIEKEEEETGRYDARTVQKYNLNKTHVLTGHRVHFYTCDTAISTFY